MIGKLFLLLTAVTAFAADDPWKKVTEIKSGAEIRVFKKGSKTPVIGKFDQATNDAVVVMLKNEEIGIDREEVDRIDARPVEKGPRLVHNSTTKQENPAKLPPAGPHRNDGPDTSSYSSGAEIHSKPDFENVYTRPAGK